MNTVLKVKNISKKIGRKSIIQRVSFEINAGEVMGLLGPNGAGKTTIIRMIVGLMQTTEGSIEILQHPLVSEFKGAIAGVGAIIENPEFYNYMSGYDNLMQYARMANRTIRKETIEQLIRDVHLEKHIRDKVKTYSLGMRQRLGVAQALIHEPQLLILDEPMNGLDPKGMSDFKEMILQLKNKGVSILISSHQLSDIEQLADRLIILQKGMITHQVTIEEIHESSQQLLVQTTDNALAKEVLEAAGFKEINETNERLVFPVEHERIKEVARVLISAGLDLYELKRKQNSLEETFLAWTQEGGL